MSIQKPMTSTPNTSRQETRDNAQSPDVSVIIVDQPPILISDSISKLEERVLQQCDCAPQCASHSSIALLEEKFLRQYSHGRSDRIQDVQEFRKSDDDGRGVGPARVSESLNAAHSASTLQGECSRKIKSEPKQTMLQESIGRSSEVDSPSSSCASARAQYYHNKLLATLQILQNKEETVRVQTESLAVAEARIASLTSRSVDLKREIERKGRELKTLRETIQASRKEKTDVSITAQIQEVDNQKNIVTTLQNNLGVIEDLYRECFYETAKQEGLIEMLRKSYLDVRLMDKEKSDQISRLHNVINTQKWSLDKCQDIASDVENLKVEISNFLNSSNNDSGVWEESLAGDLTDDLQDISGQLLRLREILTGECTCGLEEENRSLRQNNEAMKNEIDELRRKIADLENILQSKETLDRQYLDQIRSKENELHLIRQQLSAVESDTLQRVHTCESMQMQLKQTQVLLNEKTAEMVRVQTQCHQLEETVHQMEEQLAQTKEVGKEYCALRGSACAAQMRVRTLREELARAWEQCGHMDEVHRSKVESLKGALSEAQARGAALCAASTRAIRNLRAWTRHRNHLQREQELQIKEKDSQIRMLELRLEQRQNDTTLTRESEPTCPQCVSARSSDSQSFGRSQSFERMRTESPSCSKCPQIEGSCTSSARVRRRQNCTFETSASEMGSSPPVPPQRPSRMRRFFCENRFLSPTRDASVQRPERHDAAGNTESPSEAFSVCRRSRVGHASVHTIPRELPGTVDDVLSRVESAGEALADSLRRWNRHASLHRT